MKTMMKNWLLHNTKAKIASLILAVAIWFLIRSNIEDPTPPQFPIPGTSVPAPIVDPSPIPGTAIP
jgi:hypothetical protein